MDDEGETRFSKGETAVARVLERLDYEKRKGDAKAIEACTRLLQVLRVPVPN